MTYANAPLQSFGDSYYSASGVGGSFQRGNFRFDWPGGNALPQFGGFDPNSAARLGVGFRGPGGGRFNLNLMMSQGSSRSNSLASPSVVVPHGGVGFVNDSINRPFVTSFVPVVNDGFVVPISPLQERIARLATEPLPPVKESRALSRQTASLPAEPPSSAESGDISVDEIRKQNQARRSVADREREGELAEYLDRARRAEEKGKLSLARGYFHSALRRAEGERQAQLRRELERIESLLAAKNSRRAAATTVP